MEILKSETPTIELNKHAFWQISNLAYEIKSAQLGVIETESKIDIDKNHSLDFKSRAYSPLDRPMDAVLCSKTNGKIYIACRGTVINLDVMIFRDWIQDFEIKPIESGILPGNVHEGFYKSVFDGGEKSIYNFVLKEIKRDGDLPIVIVGHSKGGAMALLMGMAPGQLHLKTKDFFTILG